MAVMIEIQGLKKHFPVSTGLFSRKAGLVKAVDGVDFVLNEGQTFSLVGESGCGKTTISKLILLLEKPTSGSILFRGQPINELRGTGLKRYRASVQAVFQDPQGSLSPRLRVKSIIAEPLQANSLFTKEERGERVQAVLGTVKLDQDALSRYPHEFSGGQRQRIALARALSTNPGMVVLDEPVSALDVSIRADMMNLLKDLQEELGLAYLLIAHNLATVRHMSHYIGIMYLGKLVEKAPSEEFFSHPLHPYGQALLSAASLGGAVIGGEMMVEGEVPSPLNPPSGCRFHTRCRHAMKICSEIEPQLKDIDSGHLVACYLY